MNYKTIAKGALALALAMFVGTALASNYVQEHFEGYEVGDKIIEAGAASGWSSDTEDDASIIVEIANDFVQRTGISRPASGTPGPQALQLVTEGGTLKRELASAQSFEESDLYVDTLVQFVPSEDLLDLSDDKEIKVAAYAYITEIDEVSSVTNLAIYHMVYDSEMGPVITNTVTSKIIDADEWYRLTIKLVNGGSGFQACQVMLNSEAISDANNAYSNTWDDRLADDDVDPDGGTWFLSAATVSSTSISSVQFKGTGYIDDLVVTDEEPDYEPGGAGLPFEVTQSSDWVGGSANDQSATIEVPYGSSTTLVYTASDFYVIDSILVDSVAVTPLDSEKQHELIVGAACTIEVLFKTMGNYDAADIAWFKSMGFKEKDIVEHPTLAYSELELYGLSATNLEAAISVKITDISATEDSVSVTVQADRAYPAGKILASLRLYGWQSLGGEAVALAKQNLNAYADILGNDGKVDYNDDKTEATYTFDFAPGDYQFFKAVIEFVPVVNEG